MASILEQLDNQLGKLLAAWNIYTTALAVFITVFVAYTVISQNDPDIHPFVLSRQSSAGSVRNPGESAVYRSPDVPHGFPLRTGLSVKEKGAPAYASGKDGDLRDVWRRVTGELPAEQQPRPIDPAASSGNSSRGERPKIFTIMGKETIDHDASEITKEIFIIGDVLKKHGKRVAIYLPNSIEFLSALFACAFYGLDAILVPFKHGQNQEAVDILSKTKPDVLIAVAGSLPLESVGPVVKSIKQVIWFVEKTSRQMDWTEVPKEVGGGLEVDAWHELVQNHPDVSGSQQPQLKPSELGKIVTVWQGKSGDVETVEFTQQNMVSAIGGIIAALPVRQRFNPSDLFLACDSFTHSYTLCLTLAALFCHASLAINSVAGPSIDLNLACRGVAPTLIVASPETAASLHANTSAGVTGGLKKLAHYGQSKALEAGHMPAESFISRINAPQRAAIGTTPGKLRILFVAEKAGIDTPPLTSDDLSDLRIFTKGRVVYALTTAKVAGAVAQTHLYDYRIDGSRKHSHFGIPLSSVEVKLVDTQSHKTTDDKVEGEIVVSGPAVAGGEARLGVIGKFRDDCTLAYV